MSRWMRRRNGVNNAAMAKVEITMATGEFCVPLIPPMTCCSKTTPPKKTSARVAVSAPYTSVLRMMTSMSHRR